MTHNPVCPLCGQNVTRMVPYEGSTICTGCAGRKIAAQAARITALEDSGKAVVTADDARRTDEYDRWLSNLVMEIGRMRATLVADR